MVITQHFFQLKVGKILLQLLAMAIFPRTYPPTLEVAKQGALELWGSARANWGWTCQMTSPLTGELSNESTSYHA